MPQADWSPSGPENVDRVIAHPWVVFTDVDGTFIDVRDHNYEPLRPAVLALQARGVPIVFCTSKTYAEVQELRRELGIHDPFIVENGGAVWVEKGYFPFGIDRSAVRHSLLAIELGTPHRILADALDETERETGCEIQRFGKLSLGEVSRVTGLPPAQAGLAKQREFDEPFRFVTESASQRKTFLKNLRRRPGIRVTRGNLWYHAKGTTHKGRAVEIVKDLYRRHWPLVRFVGIGDSPNDLPMLRSVDVPILVRGSDGRFNPEISSALPHIRRSPFVAPRAWAAVLLLVLPHTSSVQPDSPDP